MTAVARMTRPAIERRDFGLTEIKLAQDSTGTFSGYGAIFGNVDGYGDTIAKGAFKATLREWEDKGKFPPMLLQHGGGPFGGSTDGMLPIGQWTSMEENSRGLKVDGRLFALQTERAQYIYEGLKAGVLDGLSIGFRTRKSITGTKPGEPIRTLTEIDLVEVSVVTFPANPKARVSSVKTFTPIELRALEDALRDAGLARRERAKAVSIFREWLQLDSGAPRTTLRDAALADTTADCDALAAADALLEKLTVGSLKF
jgi:Escherichia/Staphylococcus phage prohead protease